jgi:hypothetical protein
VRHHEPMLRGSVEDAMPDLHMFVRGGAVAKRVLARLAAG